MITVRIFHNITRDAYDRPVGFDGYQAGHVVEEVFSYEVDTHPANAAHAILRRAFEDFNVGVNGIAAKYRAKRLRSLSVGDVVQIGDEFYACDRVGWQPIARPRIRSTDGE